MKEYNVYVVIVSTEFLSGDSKEVKERLKGIHVTKFSTIDTINVTMYKDDSSYIIAFKGLDIIQMNSSVILSNIISIFDNNLPDSKIKFHISTTFINGVNDSNINEVEAVLELHNEFYKQLSSNDTYEYITSNIVKSVYDDYTKGIMGIYNTNQKEDEEEFDYDEEDDEDLDDKFKGTLELNDYLTDFIYDKDKHDKSKKKKKNSHKHYYGISSVIKTAKSPKRSYKRHGVIICKEKNAIKKDKRILREFLKEFIPGNNKWKKSLREDLLNRWIYQYALTNKELRKLEKAKRDFLRKERNSKKVQRTLEFTRKIFNVPIDKWNDPTR